MTQARALPPGTLIAGFTLSRLLGQGRFGLTYEAEQRTTGERVALKEFIPHRIARREADGSVAFTLPHGIAERALDALGAIAGQLASLDHPNLVRVLGQHRANGTAYIFLELVSGETLEEWLEARGRPPLPSELQPIIEPLLDALADLHDQGATHRAVAPDTIVLQADGSPVLIDYGAFADIVGMLRAGEPKPGYSPPEAGTAAARAGAGADLYAIGAVLYRALSGHQPTDAAGRAAAVAAGEPDPLRLPDALVGAPRRDGPAEALPRRSRPAPDRRAARGGKRPPGLPCPRRPASARRGGDPMRPPEGGRWPVRRGAQPQLRGLAGQPHMVMSGRDPTGRPERPRVRHCPDIFATARRKRSRWAGSEFPEEAPPARLCRRTNYVEWGMRDRSWPWLTGLSLGLLGWIAAGPVAATELRGGTAAPVIATSTFGAELLVGYLTGRSGEYVYDIPGRGAKLSQLNWQIDHAFTVGGRLTARPLPWLELRAGGWTVVRSDNAMDDFDWLRGYRGFNSWSDWSRHPNTDLVKAYQIDLAAAVDLAKVGRSA